MHDYEIELYNLKRKEYSLGLVIELAGYIEVLACLGKGLIIHFKDRKIVDINIVPQMIYFRHDDAGSAMNITRLKSMILNYCYPIDCTIETDIINNKIVLIFYSTRTVSL